MPRRLVLVVSLAVLVCAPLVLRAERSASAATVINVPADQPSIQGAIDVAANGGFAARQLGGPDF